MRKIMIMGSGAQGSTIAARLQEEPSVEEIVCADYDLRAAQELEKMLSKAIAGRHSCRTSGLRVG